MKTNYLFPNRVKIIGWILFIPGFLLGLDFIIFSNPEPSFFDIEVFAFIYNGYGNDQYFKFVENNFYDEFIGILLIFGAIFIALSKEKEEDEFIAQIRLESLVWATYVNYFLLLLSIIFLYGESFYMVLIINMFTLLIFFTIRFNWALYRFKSLAADEK